MKNQHKRRIGKLLIGASAVMSLLSCTKWDGFKDYIKEGEITYVGKLDSVKILSGNERVKVRALLKPDPKISVVRVFWNDMTDSLSFSLTDAQKSSRLFEELLPMPEGIVSLTFVTYDNAGNKSVAVPVVGRSYGPRYQNGLNNRLLGNAILNKNEATLDWLDMDLSTGPFATEVKYLAMDGTEKVRRVPISSVQTKIADVAATAKTISYRTLFLPQSSSIDTFATAYRAVGLARDVTAEYLKNTKVPVETSSRSDRWGIPAYWQINAAVKNFKNAAGQYFGGVDYWFNGPFLAMEAGWSADNMVSIVNGKIFQKVTLPAGAYTLEMDIPDCTAGGDFYTLAALGEGLPNIENISSAVAYLKTNSPGTHKLNFVLNQQADVSLGFVGNLPNKGAGDGTFWRITGVRLKQTVRTD